MRVLIWHGWLLEGSGSNVYAARLAEALASDGHDVVLLCQEAHPERYPWIAAAGVIGAGPPRFGEGSGSLGPGRCVLLRPDIGSLLPVFVLDRYEGFQAKTFVDLSGQELEAYLRRNRVALAGALEWHQSEAVIVSHAIPGAAVARRAVGPGRYVAIVHGSDLEYAVRMQPRYQQLAAEGLRGALAIVCASTDVARRCEDLVPGTGGLIEIVVPGVDTGRFHSVPRRDGLLEAAAGLDADPDTSLGRPRGFDQKVALGLARRDHAELDRLALAYDQWAPDQEAAGRLRALADHRGPIVGYLGKLIPQKAPELVLAGARASAMAPSVLVVGFGGQREWLAAFALAMDRQDREALVWLGGTGRISPEASQAALREPSSPSGSLTFTGRLDHRYAPGALAAMDVLVVPSLLEEAFGMVAAEGAAAGALPLVARHSGLAELARALEEAFGQEDLLSFEPGRGAAERIGAGIDRLLSLPAGQRTRIREGIRAFVKAQWSWERTASRLIELAAVDR